MAFLRIYPFFLDPVPGSRTGLQSGTPMFFKPVPLSGTHITWHYLAFMAIVLTFLISIISCLNAGGINCAIGGNKTVVCSIAERN